MDNQPFFDIEDIIRNRRTVKPEKMSGRLIDDEVVNAILLMADWAPTHARTEPWRFIVYNSAQVKEFCKTHADLYKENTPEDLFNQLKYNNLINAGHNVSHVVIACMKRVENHKIPEIEEVAATACAIQNILLTATAQGISSFWSTGGMVHHDAFKTFFNFGDEDRALGIIYLGYTNEPVKTGSRLIPVAEKIRWIQ